MAWLKHLPQFLVLAVAATASAALAQEITIPNSIAVGDRYQLVVSELKEKIQNGQTVSSFATHFNIDMAVTGTHGDHFIVTWTHRSVEVEGLEEMGPMGPVLDRVMRMAVGQKIEYYLDAEGAVAGLRNIAELLEFNQRAVDELLGAISDETGSEELAGLIRKMTEHLMEPDRLQVDILEGPQLFHFFSGLALEPGALYEYEDILPTQAGVDIPAQAEFVMHEYDPDRRLGVIDWRQFPDPAQASEAVRQMLQRIMARAGVPLPEDFDLTSVTIEDEAEYEIDLDSGLPRRLRHQRRSDILGRGRIKVTEIRRIK